METSTHIYTRLLRPVALFAGVAVYLLFTWALQQTGQIQASLTTYMQLIALWLVGLAGLVFWPRGTTDYATYILARVIWCNLGVTTLAVLVPDAVRLMLLVVPMLGVFYAALHVSQRYVVFITAISWLFYVLLTLGKPSLVAVPVQFETLMALAFASMLGASMLLACEVLRYRDSLNERNLALRATLERMQDLALKDELTGTHN